MRVHFLPTVKSAALKPCAVLLCAIVLAACNAQVIAPMRHSAASSLAPTHVVGDVTEPRAANYGVPEVSSVSFSASTPEPVVDLTY